MRRSSGSVVAVLAVAVLAVAVLAVALLAGRAGPSGGEDSGAGGESGGGAGVPGVEAPGGPGGAPADPEADRQVVTTASAFLTVEEPAEGARQVSELAESVGGRVDERVEYAGSPDGGTDGAGADLVLRVPSDELTGVLAELDELGDVVSVSVSRSDVTATAVDLDARIAALRTSVARLQALMEGAATTEALLAAEAALAERQERLESLQSQRAQLAGQVEYATLAVHLATSGVVPAGGPDGFLDGLATGWRALVSTLGTAVVVLGIALPWLAVTGLVTAGVLLLLRRARRRPSVEEPVPAPD